MKIVIYGLGKDGMRFLKSVIGLENIEIVAVSDSDDEAVNKLDTEERALFKESKEALESLCDCIVISSSKFFEEIKNQIISQGIPESKLVSVSQFGDMQPQTKYCNVCHSQNWLWEHFGQDFDIFCRKKIIGGGRRRCLCPKCASVDRIRFVLHILQHYTDIFTGKGSVLHFAPEIQLEEKLKQVPGISYLSADVEPGRADIIADITKLQFGNDSFDYIICNHVMEHICEEKTAFHEIYRCLKKGGILVFSVPICWEEETYEDCTIEDREERIKAFGQDDHVRLYGTDTAERIKSFGFEVCCLKSNEIFSEEDISRLGLINGDAVFLCRKA